MASSISPSYANAPWQRFTVLDGLLLQAGYALAFSMLMTPLRRQALETLNAGSLVLIAATFCLGSVLAGPIVLGTQWLVRGRRMALSAGEWLWLSPIGIAMIGAFGVWAIHWLTVGLPDSKEVRAIYFAFFALLLLLVEIGCVINSLLVFMARSMGDLSNPPCSWTDRFGALTCLLVGILILLVALAILR